jgi:23S rRNA-/tRNA-specific pseudouridylate synthase
MVNILRKKTQNKDIAPVHRLGRGTTGAIIFTKVFITAQTNTFTLAFSFFFSHIDFMISMVW